MKESSRIPKQMHALIARQQRFKWDSCPLVSVMPSPEMSFRLLQFLFVTAAAVSVASSLKATVIYDNFESTYGPAGYVRDGVPRFHFFQTYVAPASFPYAGQRVAELWTKQDFVYPNNVLFRAQSDRREVFPYHNNPDIERTDEPSLYNQIMQLLIKYINRQGREAKDAWKDPNGTSIVSGVRGGLGGSLTVFDLTENSPAWATFIEPPELGLPFVPFIVNNAGDGDTLTIYGNDGILWNRSLTGLEIDTLYFAVLPEYTAQTMSYTSVWLNSVGQANASVSIGIGWDFELPEAPAQVSESGWTISLLGLSLGACVIARRRTSSAVKRHIDFPKLKTSASARHCT